MTLLCSYVGEFEAAYTYELYPDKPIASLVLLKGMMRIRAVDGTGRVVGDHNLRSK